jgi:DNA-binding transcriptional regulator LsrR (DeoR family)
MPDPDPIAVFQQADRAYRDSLLETNTLDCARAEALLRASADMSISHLAAATGLTGTQVRRLLARARQEG